MKKKIITVTLNPCIDKTITVEGFSEGGLNRIQKVRADAGGKGINVAKVLKRLGAEVVAIGILAEGGRETMLAELNERKISYDFLTFPGDIRTNYKIFDKEKEQVTEMNEAGFFVEETKLAEVENLVRKHLADCGVMVLSGSLAPGIPKDFYKRLILLAKAYSVRVILDADGEALVKGLEAKPFALKPNHFELEQLCGKTLDTQEKILACGKDLLQCGVELIAVSQGAEGAIYMTPEKACQVQLYPIACQSTVAAGDSMVAAMAFSLVEDRELEALARLSSAAGTITASKPGTEVCTLGEVLDYQEKLILSFL